MSEHDHDKIRQDVSKAYAKAVADPSGGCCGSATGALQPRSSCCGGPLPKGAVAQLAGYTVAELDLLPIKAAENAFGCGNPVAFSEVEPGQAVLDLGSGAGIDLLLAAKKVGPTGRVIGVDMTDEMIAQARANIAEAGMTDRVEVRKGIIESLPVEDASVDWVISNCVINLSPEKPRVFAEITRVLKPGGRMLVSDIVVEDLPDWIRESAALYSSCVAGAISEPEYLDGLRAAGLEDVEVLARQVYDATQLAAFIDSEVPGAEEVLSCCGGEPVDGAAVSQVTGEVVGKIWSAKVKARKPGA